MIDININGINTIIQDMMSSPCAHNIFNKKVKIIITKNLKNAVLYNPLNISIIICVSEKIKYIKAGGHKFCRVFVI